MAHLRCLLILFVLAFGLVASMPTRAADRIRIGCAGSHGAVCYPSKTVFSHSAVQVRQKYDYAHKEYVPFAVEVNLNPDYFFSVRDYYRDQLLADAIAYRILSQGGGTVSGGGGAGPRQPMPPAEGGPFGERPAPRKTGPTPGPGPVRPGFKTEIDPKLKASIDNACIKCHTAGGQRVDLTDPASVPPGVRWEAHGRVNSGDMPFKAKELPNEEVVLYYEWALAGSKAVAQGRDK